MVLSVDQVVLQHKREEATANRGATHKNTNTNTEAIQQYKTYSL